MWSGPWRSYRRCGWILGGGDAMTRPPMRRRRFYVHGIQRKYLFLSLVPIIISAFLIIAFLFLPLDVLLFSSVSPAAKQVILQDLRALGFRIWPAIFLGMIVSASLSVFVTHRFAGPIYRFHRLVDQMAEGDLSARFKLRKGDDLTDLETAVNRAIDSLAGTVQDTQRPLGDLAQRLERVLARGWEGPEPFPKEDLAELLEKAREAQTALGRLKVAQDRAD
jgi:methyl-accepting chemotaxis protein